jgi:uncharacterized protein (TIRG00374 family)
MNTENLTGEDPLTDPKKSQFKGLMVYFQFASFLIGIVLLILVIYEIGLQTIADALGRVGWGFLIVIGLNGSRHFLRALSLYLAIPAQHRSFKFRYALAARLGGEAVSFATFTGPFLGEATKAAMLKRNVPLAQGVTAVVVDNILYDISVGLLVLGGVGALFYIYGDGSDDAIEYALIGVSAAIALGFAALLFAAREEFKPATWLFKKLSAKNLLPGLLEKKKQAVFQLEENVYQFYRERKGAFFAVSGLIAFSHMLSFVEVYLVMTMLGLESSASTAFIIESLNKIINSVFSFVPGTVGVSEGGNGIILRTLGYETAAGVTLALVRRGAMLFWIIIGLIILIWRMVLRGSQHFKNRHEED